MAGTRSHAYDIALALEDEACEYCDDGTLARGVHKGNPAIVCASCDTPAAQFW